MDIESILRKKMRLTPEVYWKHELVWYILNKQAVFIYVCQSEENSQIRMNAKLAKSAN